MSESATAGQQNLNIYVLLRFRVSENKSILSNGYSFTRRGATQALFGII